QAGATRMEKAKEIGPPTPISPANMMPIFAADGSKAIDFSWTPMASAAGYRLRGFPNPFFSSAIIHRRRATARDSGSRLTRGGVLLGSAGLRSEWQGVHGERKEPLYHHCQRRGQRDSDLGTGSACTTWACDRGNRQN